MLCRKLDGDKFKRRRERKAQGGRFEENVDRDATVRLERLLNKCSIELNSTTAQILLQTVV